MGTRILRCLCLAMLLCRDIARSLESPADSEEPRRTHPFRRAIDGSRGRKYYDEEEDGPFEGYGSSNGRYDPDQQDTDFSDIRNNVPGEPGVDYPSYIVLPQTAFRCQPHFKGYYADESAGCQVFHVCDGNYLVSSFLCPIGSIFSQKFLTCDWWSKVNCSSTENEMKEAFEKEEDPEEKNEEAVVTASPDHYEHRSRLSSRYRAAPSAIPDAERNRGRLSPAENRVQAGRITTPATVTGFQTGFGRDATSSRYDLEFESSDHLYTARGRSEILAGVSSTPPSFSARNKAIKPKETPPPLRIPIERDEKRLEDIELSNNVTIVSLDNEEKAIKEDLARLMRITILPIDYRAKEEKIRTSTFDLKPIDKPVNFFLPPFEFSGITDSRIDEGAKENPIATFHGSRDAPIAENIILAPATRHSDPPSGFTDTNDHESRQSRIIRILSLDRTNNSASESIVRKAEPKLVEKSKSAFSTYSPSRSTEIPIANTISNYLEGEGVSPQRSNPPSNAIERQALPSAIKVPDDARKTIGDTIEVGSSPHRVQQVDPSDPSAIRGLLTRERIQEPPSSDKIIPFHLLSLNTPRSSDHHLHEIVSLLTNGADTPRPFSLEYPENVPVKIAADIPVSSEPIRGFVSSPPDPSLYFPQFDQTLEQRVPLETTQPRFRLELPDSSGILDFQSGQHRPLSNDELIASVPGSEQLVEATKVQGEPTQSEEREKTVVETELIPSLGFSLNTSEERDQYMDALTKGLLPDVAPIESSNHSDTTPSAYVASSEGS